MSDLKSKISDVKDVAKDKLGLGSSEECPGGTQPPSKLQGKGNVTDVECKLNPTLFESARAKMMNQELPIIIHQNYKGDPNKTMKANVWRGAEDTVWEDMPAPLITDPGDAIVKITTTTICGSDLHMFHHEVAGVDTMRKGDILGHEAVGIVEAIGPDVKNIKVGDRVCISAVIACGQCDYCQQESYSLCNNTNPSSEMEKVYGHRLAGVFGYTHLTGGYAGLQAEKARVPIADVNLLKLPDGFPDHKALVLSDILCTGFHGTELGDVRKGDVVVVAGCGPVGLMAAYCAKMRGAKQVVSFDNNDFRLSIAQKCIGCDVINFDKVSDLNKEIFEITGGGADVSIDCVGFRTPSSKRHWIMKKLKTETDSSEVIDCLIYVTKKGGRMALIGDYFGTCNMFPIGALMEKNIRTWGGQLFCQKYWKTLLPKLVSGEWNIDFVFTHDQDASTIPQSYHTFSKRQENFIKCCMRTINFDAKSCCEEGYNISNTLADCIKRAGGEQKSISGYVASAKGKMVDAKETVKQHIEAVKAGAPGVLDNVTSSVKSAVSGLSASLGFNKDNSADVDVDKENVHDQQPLMEKAKGAFQDASVSLKSGINQALNSDFVANAQTSVAAGVSNISSQISGLLNKNADVDKDKDVSKDKDVGVKDKDCDLKDKSVDLKDKSVDVDKHLDMAKDKAKDLKGQGQDLFAQKKADVQSGVEQAKAKAGPAVEDLKTQASAKVTDLKEQALPKIDMLKDKAADLKAQAGPALADLKDKASAKAADLKVQAQPHIDMLKDKAADLKTQAGPTLDDLKTKATAKAAELKDNLDSTLSSVQSNISSALKQDKSLDKDKSFDKDFGGLDKSKGQDLAGHRDTELGANLNKKGDLVTHDVRDVNLGVSPGQGIGPSSREVGVDAQNIRDQPKTQPGKNPEVGQSIGNKERESEIERTKDFTSTNLPSSRV